MTVVRGGGRTPEELDTLLEDACIAHDVGAVLALFDDGAVLAGEGTAPARGAEEIARAATAIWHGHGTYLAGARRVIEAGDLALCIGGGITVARRGPDGAWRFRIALLHIDHPARVEEP